MKLKLMTLSVGNFKGLKSLSIDFNGKDTRICGANAVGKTTIADAFNWLLFGKDAEGDKDFPIKPRDDSGNDIHHLTTFAEALFERDDRTLSIRRELTEKWTKPRGVAEAVYGGNTESFFINGIASKKGEYSDFVSKLIGGDESAFMLVTSPTAFNSMDWKTRRDMLIRVCPVNVEKEVLDSPEFDGIRDHIIAACGNTDKLLKSLRDERKLLQKDLDAIPIRIEEILNINRSVSEQELKDARYAVDDYGKTLESLDEIIASTMAGGRDRSLNDAKDKARSEYNAAVSRQRELAIERSDKKNELEYLIRNLDLLINDLERRIGEAQNESERFDKIVNDLREAWKKTNAETPDEISVEICPTCGRKMPDELIEEVANKHREEFFNGKYERLADIKADACYYKDKAQKNFSYIEKARETMAEYRAQKAVYEEQLADMSKQSEAEINASEAVKNAENALKKAEAAIDAVAMCDDVKLEELKRRRIEVREHMDRANDVIKAYEAFKAASERISSLEIEAKQLTARIAESEVMTMDIEEYIRRRSELLESSVNGMFPTVRFKLKKMNINGGTEDCCTCFVVNPSTGALVPWDKANGAGKINAGLEIVNVLSDNYGIQVPVIIDNAESVNELIGTRGQRIALVVTTDKELVIIGE